MVIFKKETGWVSNHRLSAHKASVKTTKPIRQLLDS